MESWYPGEYKSPTYPSIPRIATVDAVRPTLRRLRKRHWTKARNAALAQWEASGLEFAVVTGEDVSGTNCYPGSITLHREDLSKWAMCPDCRPPSGYGSWSDARGCGSVLLDPAVWGVAYLTKLVAHEVGHVLGFGHGGTGIMIWGYAPYSSGQVNQEEIEAVRSYYALG